MAHQPMLLPDPSERPFLPEGSFAPARGPEWLEEDSGNYLAELAAKLASHGGGESSADLALDLMLNKIVDQARLSRRKRSRIGCSPKYAVRRLWGLRAKERIAAL